MENLRLGKLVRSVTVVERGSSNERSGVVIFRGKRKKKKGTRGLSEFDRALRTWVDAQETYAKGYARAHRKSNRKSKDGWLRDMNLNVARAARKGGNKFRWDRWMLP